MRSKLFPVLVMLLGVIIAGAAACAWADSITATAQVSTSVIIQGILGGLVAGGGGAVAILRGRVAKMMLLLADLKICIEELTEMANFVRQEIKSPEAVKEWNDAIGAVAKLLIDTGNASLVQKGETLLKRKIA